MSHPVWVRGLKLHTRSSKGNEKGVAPRVGAWIETPFPQSYGIGDVSHPVWVRGLKHNNWFLLVCVPASHPVWVRGLKPFCQWYGNGRLCRTPCGCVD